MINNIEYKEDGSLDLDTDNTELLAGRADIDNEVKAQELLDREGRLGGIRVKEDKLNTDLKRTGWKEAKKPTDVKHVCPVCGTRYWGRPNKDYCTIKCKEVAKKRRQRKRKRDIRDFHPYRGKAGEVYFMSEVKDKPVITFVPAFNADCRARAKQYLEDTFSEDKEVEDYYEQVKGVIRK